MSIRALMLVLLCTPLIAQSESPTLAAVDDNFVHRQFGDSCSVEPQWRPATGDLDGDGIEDIVIVARCKNALIDQGEKGYRVIDPLDAFFGYGNPAITSGFGQGDPRQRGVVLLVIHGAGPEAWRAAQPKEKFVIINLAIKTIAVKKMTVRKKKPITAIYVEESTGDQMTGAIFWNGHKYKYEPLGSAMQ